MIDQNLIELCRQKLISTKADLMNRFQIHIQDFRDRNKGHTGDEADQTMSLQAEHQMLAIQQRMRRQLLEIESALARIQARTFGICEETEEPIEANRLLAIPWTRLSLEGAEIRESKNRSQEA